MRAFVPSEAGGIIVANVEDDAFTLEAKGPLPNNLQLVSLDFKIVRGGRAWTADWKEIEADAEFGAYLRILGSVGEAACLLAGEPSVFGTQPSVRVRLDVLATEEVIKKWIVDWRFDANEEQYGFGELKFRDKKRNWAECSHQKIFESLAHRYVGHDEFERGAYEFKGQYAFDTFDWRKPGDFARWTLTAQATDKDFERLAALSAACNYDVESIVAALDRLNAKPEPQSFLVPGLIPRGALTLLLGNKKVGKSAMALELAVAVARRESTWMGFPLDAGEGGFAAYTHGEDSAGTVLERVALMTGGETPYLLHSIPADQGDIDDVLARLEKQKVALLVVDPARKYYRGDEDGSDAVSEFFGKLETFAREKNCAALVSHHLKRNASPRNLADVATLYRGSSVFLDRPRVTLATLRAGNETQFGIPAPDGVPLHNFLASTMFSGVRRLRRDESTFRHVPIGGQSASVAKAPTTAEAQTVLAAIGDLLAAGKKITRTGKAGVFEIKLPRLASMSRAAVRSVVDGLVQQGALDSADDGTLTLPAVPAETVPADLVG